MPPKYIPLHHSVGDERSQHADTTSNATTPTIHKDQPTVDDDTHRHPHSNNNNNNNSYTPSPPPCLHHSYELLEVAILRLLGSFRNYAGRHPEAVDMIENLPQATEFVSRFVASYASTEGLHCVLDHRAAGGIAPSDSGQHHYYSGGAADGMSNSYRGNRSNPNFHHEQYFSSSFETDSQNLHQHQRSPSPACHQQHPQHQTTKKVGSSSSSHKGPLGTPPTAPLNPPSPHVKCRVPAANLHLPPTLQLSECLPRDSPMSPPIPRPSHTSTPRSSQAREEQEISAAAAASAATPGSVHPEATTNSDTVATTTPQQLRTTPRRNSVNRRSPSSPAPPQQQGQAHLLLHHRQHPRRQFPSSNDADMSPEMIAQLINEVEASILAHDEGIRAMAANRLVMATNAAAVTKSVAADRALSSSPASSPRRPISLTANNNNKTISPTTASTTKVTSIGAPPAIYVHRASAAGGDDLTVSQATTAYSSATSSPTPQITFSGGTDDEVSGAAITSTARAASVATTTTAPITFAGEERDFTTSGTPSPPAPTSMNRTAAPPAAVTNVTKKPTQTTAPTTTAKKSCSNIISDSHLGAIATGAAESFLSRINMDKEPAAARAVTTAKVAAAACMEMDDDDLENDIPKLDVENIKFLINALKPLSTEVLEEICYEWGNLPAHGRRARRKYRLRGDRLRRQQLAAKSPPTPPASSAANSTALPHLRSMSETKQEETEAFEGSDYFSSTTSKTTTDSFRFSQLSDFEGKEDIDMCTVSFSSLLDSEDSDMKRLRAPVVYNTYRGDDDNIHYNLNHGFEDVDVVSDGSSEGVQRKGIIIMPKTGIIPTTAAERIKKRRAARKAAKESTMTKAEIRKTSKAKRERRDRRYFQEAIGQRIRFLAVNLLVTTCISFQRETGRKLLVSMDAEDSHEQQQVFTDAEIDDMLFSVCHILANDTRDSSLCVLASSFGLVNVTSVNRLPAFMPNLIICMGLLALLQPLPQLLLQRILVELNVHAAQKALLASAKDTTTNANAKRGGMTRTQQRAQETAAAEAALLEARRLESAIEPMSEESVAKAKAAAAMLSQEGAGRYGGGDDNDEDGCDAQETPLLPMGGVEDVADDFKDKYCYPIATHVFPLVMKSPMLTDLKALPINSKLSVFESSTSNYSVQISSYVHTHFVDRQRLVSEPFTCKLYPMVEEKKSAGGKNGGGSGGGASTSAGSAGGGKKGGGAGPTPSSSSRSVTAAPSTGPSSSGVKGKLEKIKFRAECVISGSHVSFRIFHRAPPLTSKNTTPTTASSDHPATITSRRALHVMATVMTNVKKGSHNHGGSTTAPSSSSRGGGKTTQSASANNQASRSVAMTKNAILYAGERLVFDDFIPADAAGGIDGAGCGAGGGAGARGADFYDVSTDMLSFKLNLEILDDCTEVVAQNRLEVIESSGTTPSLTNSPAPHCIAQPSQQSTVGSFGGGDGGINVATDIGDDEDDLPPLLLGADRTTSEVDGAVNNLMSKLQKTGGSGGSGSSLTAAGATSAGLGGGGSSSHINTSSENRNQ